MQFLIGDMKKIIEIINSLTEGKHVMKKMMILAGLVFVYGVLANAQEPKSVSQLGDDFLEWKFGIFMLLQYIAARLIDSETFMFSGRLSKLSVFGRNTFEGFTRNTRRKIPGINLFLLLLILFYS